MTRKTLNDINEISNDEFHGIRNMLDEGLERVREVVRKLLVINSPGNSMTKEDILQIVKRDLNDKMERGYSKEYVVKKFCESTINIKQEAIQGFFRIFTGNGSEYEYEQIVRLSDRLPDILNNEDRFIGFMGMQILKEMCMVIGNVISTHYEHACIEKAGIYVWPGYERVPGTNPVKSERQERFVLKDRFSDKSGKGGDLDCGMGIDYNIRKWKAEKGVNPKYYYNSATSIFFDRILLPTEGEYSFKYFDEDNKETKRVDGFSPGGTHKWMSHGDIYIKAKKGENPKLDVLCISCEDGVDKDEEFMENAWKEDTLKDGREIVIDEKNSYLEIRLRKDRRERWGDDIGRVLNDESDSLLTFPDGTYWPASNNSKEKKDETKQKIRRELYSIWLSASFRCDELNDDWIKKNFTAKYKHEVDNEEPSILADKVEDAMRLLRENSERPGIQKRFNYWYILRLNKSIAFSPLLCQKDDRDSDISTLDVLGSIMILAEEKIHPLILLEIKEWVDYIYLSIRDLENNLVSEDIGKQEGRVEDYRVQAHETKDYVNLIRNDTPEQLLEMTRDYFSTLYAASSDEFVDYYEKYLKEKNAVGDILKEAIWFALRLWLAIPMLKICGDFQEEWLNDKVDEYFQKYFKNGIDGLKKVIIKTNDKECLWYFFCALIALNKNILKNSEALWEKIQDSGSKEIEGSVEFQLSHDYKTLIVFNKYIKGKQGIDPNKYGTEKVLVHYAVKYKKKDFNNKDVGMKLDGPVKTVLGNNVYKFMTRIPILE